MKILFITGLNFPKNLNSYDKIFALNYLNYKILKKKIKHIKCLSNLKISNKKRIDFHRNLKKNLILETKTFNKRWAYLAKDYMLWRYLNFLNYQELIKKLINNKKKNTIILSSPKNLDFTNAIISIKHIRNIELKFHNMDNLKQTSPHKYGGHFDLIESEFLTSKFNLILLAIVTRFLNFSGCMYVKYPNLTKFKNYMKFSDFLSIGFNFKSIIYKIKRNVFKNQKIEQKKIFNFNEKNKLYNLTLDRNNWKSFNLYEFRFINSLYNNYLSKIQSFKEIDKIFENYLLFFKYSKLKELVLDQDNSMRSKLIIYSLKKLNIKSSFYFHGYSDDNFWFGKNYKKNIYDIDKIYTWTPNSKKNLFKKFGRNVEIINSNKFKKKKIVKRKFFINKKTRVLVLGSTWTNMSFMIPHDCFERTLIDSVSILNSLNILNVDVKIKPVENFFYENYFKAIKLIKSNLNLKFNIINDDLTEKFINKYDLIICDKTTGLIESYASNVHTVTYIGNFKESAFIDYKKLKICKTFSELKKSIINVNKIDHSYYQGIYREFLSNQSK